MCFNDLQGPADVGWRSLRGLLQALIPSLLMNLHIVYEGPFRCVPEDTVFFRPEELEEEKRAHSKRATSLDTSSRDGSKSANSCPPHPCKRSKAATL